MKTVKIKQPMSSKSWKIKIIKKFSKRMRKDKNPVTDN